MPKSGPNEQSIKGKLIGNSASQKPGFGNCIHIFFAALRAISCAHTYTKLDVGRALQIGTLQFSCDQKIIS